MSEPAPTNLDGLLSDIYKEYISIRDEDFNRNYTVLKHIVLDQIHSAMKKVDRYYEKYQRGASMLGSHFDRLRVEKPDEFDVEFPINLPISMETNPADPEDSDINFRMGKRGSAYMELRMGTQFQNLPKRDDWETNITAYKWMDSKMFLSRAKFYSWFQKVVDKALNKFRDTAIPVVDNEAGPQKSKRRRKKKNRGPGAKFDVDGIEYTVRRKQSGPAVTLIIENVQEEFCLHVDLVPALRFSEKRWPVSRLYRDIPTECKTGFWSVVPKPDKQWQGGVLWSPRSWRASLHFQEKRYIHDLYNLRQAIRLIKKLRNALEMHEIKSYFIKTIFMWKASTTEPTFWKNSPGDLFKVMVQELYNAVCKRKIPYFWNKKCNLLELASKEVLETYAKELKELLEVLDDPLRLGEVPEFILSEAQLLDYNDESVSTD